MEYKFQYENAEDKQRIIKENQNKILIKDESLFEGNFITFVDELPLSDQVRDLKSENQLLRAQNKALTERADFVEDLIAEMAMQVYQ